MRAPGSTDMAQRDLYEILGVTRAATTKEIRKAYRELARKYHPDRNPGNKDAEERFKEASYASEILLNEDKRKIYDEFGEIGLREGFNADAYRRYQQGPAERGRGFGGFGGLEDLFGQMGGRGGGARVPFRDIFGGDVVETIFGEAAGRSRKQDLVSDVTVEFAEAVRGAEREMTVQTPGQEARTIKVRIPPGVRDGGRVRVRGQGEEGGDILLRVRVKEHPYFKRDHYDLLLELPITVGEGYRGAKVQVPTPDGPVTVKVPKGVRGGAKLRLRGKGVPHGSERGDLIVQLHIVLPDSEKIADAVDEIEAAYAESIRKGISL